MSACSSDETNDPAIRSWVESAHDHPDFPIQNLPFGVFTPASEDEPDRRGGIRIGDDIVDLRALARSGLVSGAALTGAEAAAEPTLNAFFALGPVPRKALRSRVHRLLTESAAEEGVVRTMLYPARSSRVHLPAAVGDFTDFYVGIHHATNVGTLFRPDSPLLPNYKWVPIGYHGRASSVRVSGEPFHRPRGQRKPPGQAAPVYEPCGNLDFELELGVWIGPGNDPGRTVPVGQAAEHAAGYCLLNDWSARDVQAWEYQPLGPFLAKNFATTVSAWVVTPEALAPYRTPVARPADDPAPLPYLSDPADQLAGGLDVELEALVSTEEMRRQALPDQSLSVSSSRHMYWTVAQLIAHHTSGGCDLRPGDLLGTGTISAPGAGGYGSLLEMTMGGKHAVRLSSGETRTFLEDGDEVALRARANRPGAAPIGFGECRARVLHATT
jgi:fumarylacetoacetase